jgi:bifunctional UDP-N-acetylglucosamine pyrophosphorylase/glucosamine-1-phosphate N-acetyltransferase
VSIGFIILAAGAGTRMRSAIPKVFQSIAGRPIIRYVIDVCKSVDPQEIISVVSLKLEKNDLFKDTKTVVQISPLGTADAVLQALPFLEAEYTIIVCGDAPLIEKQYFELLINDGADISLIAVKIPVDLGYMPYGRIIIDKDGFQKIVEYKNATAIEKQCEIANTGIYKIKTTLLKKYIHDVKKDEISKEFYLTDLLKIFKDNAHTISIIHASEYWLFHGINTMEDLVLAEKIVQEKLRKKFLDSGVRLLNPESIYLAYDTEIEPDVLIEQNVVIKKNVKIKNGSVIKAFSYLEDCEIMQNAEIGPFARIRGGSVFMPNSDIGNFVEIKGSIVGEKTKIKHLTYIGDAEIAENVNIGAGTVVCNYDGVKKHKTLIKKGAFVGSNSTLIAPVKIGDDSIIGAGSVINKNVPQNGLAVARAEQKIISDKADKIWKRKGKFD